MQARRLRMIAGPNGSGKSSIVRQLAKERSENGVFWLNHYLNPDDVERALVSTGLDLAPFKVQTSLAGLCDSLRKGGRLAADHPFFCQARLDGSVLFAQTADGYLAASVVDFLRDELMRHGESFSFETVMPHRGKVDDFERARDQGYKTYLYFVCTNSADLNVARVRVRVSTGGHAVPEEKIRERYLRSLELAREAVSYAYRAYFFDNSGAEAVRVAEFDPLGNCSLKLPSSNLPPWFRRWVWNPDA
jgi:predicted ABC-type ATPase